MSGPRRRRPPLRNWRARGASSAAGPWRDTPRASTPTRAPPETEAPAPETDALLPPPRQPWEPARSGGPPRVGGGWQNCSPRHRMICNSNKRGFQTRGMTRQAIHGRPCARAHPRARTRRGRGPRRTAPKASCPVGPTRKRAQNIRGDICSRIEASINYVWEGHFSFREFCLALPSVPSCATVGQALRELAGADVLAAPAAGPHVCRCTMNKQSDDTGVEANVCRYAISK